MRIWHAAACGILGVIIGAYLAIIAVGAEIDFSLIKAKATDCNEESGYCGWLQVLFAWQDGWAGILGASAAALAAALTIWATRVAARETITATREAADSTVLATRRAAKDQVDAAEQQIKVAEKQILLAARQLKQEQLQSELSDCRNHIQNLSAQHEMTESYKISFATYKDKAKKHLVNPSVMGSRPVPPFLLPSTLNLTSGECRLAGLPLNCITLMGELITAGMRYDHYNKEGRTAEDNNMMISILDSVPDVIDRLSKAQTEEILRLQSLVTDLENKIKAIWY